jgi:hypothetical protein
MKHGVLLSFLLCLACTNMSLDANENQTNRGVSAPLKACPSDSQKQTARSNELQEIVKADQADRQLPGDKIDWSKVTPADEVRAKRVAEIFAEGCFKSAKDYAAAALVFQHGLVPDHYYQAYLWSKKALDLGDNTQKLMVANSIDRYLISLGYKQLFGAQSFRNGPHGCLCLGPTEKEFSDQLRVQISGLSLGNRVKSLQESNKYNPACGAVLYCDKKLRTPPHGLFPGIW